MPDFRDVHRSVPRSRLRRISGPAAPAHAALKEPRHRRSGCLPLERGHPVDGGTLSDLRNSYVAAVCHGDLTVRYLLRVSSNLLG